MDKLETMRAFVAVAHEGSFTSAAKRLGLSTKLVSKYVAALEARLSVQMFNRTTRSVSVTDAGSAYLERCRGLLEQFDELEAFVQERQTALSGPIRVTAPTGFGSTRLIDPLRRFMIEHPEVSVDLRLSDVQVSLVEEGLDLAIRIGTLRDSTLVARKLADMPLICVASPQYLAEFGRPNHPSDLASHNCLIAQNGIGPDKWMFQKGGEKTTVSVSGSFHVNAPAGIAAMAQGGFGVGTAPFYVVQSALQDGRLEQLFGDYALRQMGLYALYPPNRHVTARVRALIDHLVDVYADTLKTPS